VTLKNPANDDQVEGMAVALGSVANYYVVALERDQPREDTLVKWERFVARDCGEW